jgi:hypothetical protein
MTFEGALKLMKEGKTIYLGGGIYKYRIYKENIVDQFNDIAHLQNYEILGDTWSVE